MAQKKRLVLVDASALVYRAFFAIPPNLTTRAGLHTNAIFGVAMMFRKLFAGRRPDFAAVVFDSPTPTFRDRTYPAYKAARPPMPAELSEQLRYVDELVAVYRFARLRLDGWEADDVIGTLTTRAVLAGMDVLIVSPDKDFAQLVGDDVRTLDTLRDITYDAELVRKKFGVPPSLIVDLFALMGDAVDNIPGVNGIGQKGAAALLEKYGSLDELLAHTSDLKGRQRTALETERDRALLSQKLARIDCQAPIDIELPSLAVEPPETALLDDFYRRLEFFSLLGEQRRGDGPTRAATIADATQVASLDDATMAPAVTVDGRWLGLGVVAGDAALFVPFDDAPPPALAAWLADATRKKTVHDYKQSWRLCRMANITLAGVVFDTQLASFLVDPNKLLPHRLDQVAREYVQRLPRLWKELTDPTVDDIAAWAVEQCDAIAAVAPVLRTRVADIGLAEHLLEHELPLSEVLGQMELDGVCVDAADLAAVEVELQERLAAREQRIHTLAGHAFNIGSTKQLAQVLFEELKLPVIKRNKTGYSTDSEVLERLAPKHEIAAEIVEHRKLAKLISTYTSVLAAAVAADGRVHATFQQTTGVSGRIISTDPDLQRTPIRTPEGKRIRRAFVAPAGTRIISADWSQIELRVLAHVSGDAALVAAFTNGVDVHRRTASQLFHCAPEDVTAAQRAVGKTVNFATIYGQGATALGQILGIARREAQGYIEGYFAAYAGVRSWLDDTIAEAHETGYVSTLLGRRRYIPELASRNEIDRQTGERMAANTPIQGSAADLCKLAMLRIARELSSLRLSGRMVMQIHDELVFEAPVADVDAVVGIAREVMQTVYPLRVPLVVDVGVGANWAEAH